MALAQAMKAQEHPKPEFIRAMDNDYKSKIAHVFIVHGNINDYCDNSGVRQPIHRVLAAAMDDNVEKDMKGAVAEKGGRGLQDEQEIKSNRKVTRVLATFNLSQGLEFAHKNSHSMWVDAMKSFYADQIENWPIGWDKPSSIEACCGVLQRWFVANKEIQRNNEAKIMNNLSTQPELLLTILFTDGDSTFPQGDIAQLYADRPQIVHIRNWARDEHLGNRNRIIIMTRHLSEIHESLRGGGVGISTILITKPTITDREEWLHNFSSNIESKVKAKGKPMIIGSNEVTRVNLAADFDLHQFAVQAAGMSRRQMEFVIMKSWLTSEPIDFRLVREQKQRALEDEYQGIVEFFEPEYGFELIGGHEHLKKYFQRKVIIPLQQGNARLCTRGILMTGPPGCQPAGSKVLIENGTWKNVEDIVVGDKVISPQYDGSTVIATVTETVIHRNRPIYEVATLGRSRKKYRCADNHIIPYVALIRPRTPIAHLVGYKSSEQGSVMSKHETKRLRRQSVVREHQVGEYLEKGANYRAKARIFTTPAIELPGKVLAIHPYVMGALLGDGGLTHQPNFTNANPLMFDRLASLGIEFGKYNPNSISRGIVGMSAQLIKASAVYGRNSYTKFVPEEYKTSSLSQRLSLLAGLIDTDGSVDSYTTCSEQLAKDFVDLVHSVGGFANYKPRVTHDQNGTECLSFRAHYSFAEHIPGLTEVHKDRGNRDMEWKNPRMRGFDATYVGIADVYGFVLNSPSEWYITDDWLVTHNTGKTQIAKALAKEAKMNFMIGHLDRLFGGLVGETEQKTRKFLEAVDSAAPCIVFLDEMDSVLSSGRQSAGDSGTSARVFSSIMTWLSDESRSGRVVALGATNRPDLLDAALIRDGRFDAKIPALPPQKGDAKGRASILGALLRKHSVKFAKEVAATEKDPNNGIGRLLHDKNRVWTGAEVEVVLKEALDNAYFAGRTKGDGKPDYNLTIEDWNSAMDDILPNTEEVERMTLLSLLFVNHLGYVDVAWRQIAGNKALIKEELKKFGQSDTDSNDD